MNLELKRSLSEETDLCVYSGLCSINYCLEKHFISNVSATASRHSGKSARAWLSSGEFSALRRELTETSKALSVLEKEIAKVGPTTNFTPRNSSISERWCLTTSVFLFRGKLFPRVCLRAANADGSSPTGASSSSSKADLASNHLIEATDFEAKVKTSVDSSDNASFMALSPFEFNALRFHEPSISRFVSELRGLFFVFGGGSDKARAGREIVKAVSDFMSKSRYGDKMTLRIANSDRGDVDGVDEDAVESEMKKNWVLASSSSSSPSGQSGDGENASPTKKRRIKKSPQQPTPPQASSSTHRRSSSEDEEDEGKAKESEKSFLDKPAKHVKTDKLAKLLDDIFEDKNQS